VAGLRVAGTAVIGWESGYDEHVGT
jgi:hypothetical protein